MLNKISTDELTNEELGYITGLFIGDGYAIHQIKTRHFDAMFFLHSEKDLDIQNYLVEILRKVGCNPRIKKDKRFKCNRVLISSKMFFEFLMNLPFNMPLTKDFKIGFVSGLIDSEGYVNPVKREINVVNTHSALITVLHEYLKEFGISSKIFLKKWKNKNWSTSFHLRISLKLLSIHNNSIKVARLKTLQIAG